MATVGEVREAMQARMDELASESTSLETALGQLEDEAAAKALIESLESLLLPQQTPKKGGWKGEGKLCEVSGCSNPGPHRNLGPHNRRYHKR